MTQYATIRKETWWEVVQPNTIVWPDLRANQVVLNFNPLVEAHSRAWSNLVLLSEQNMSVLNFWPTDFDTRDQPVSYSEIDQSDIPEREPYLVKKPIPVVVERESATDFVATFRAGNVSIAGESFRDAFQWLVCEILDTFDALIDSRTNLGPDAARQLSILSDYIAKTDGATR